MSVYRLVNVQHRKRSFGRSCIHCARSATVRAVRVRIDGGNRMDLDLCDDHFELVEATINETREV